MEIQRLIAMANQIGGYFASDPDPQVATAGVADHLARFWAPAMRRQLLAWLDDGGEGLAPLVAEALSKHRNRLEPNATP